MIEQSKYIKDAINIGDDLWLVFERDQRHRGGKNDAIIVYLRDNHTDSTTRLATLHNGVWSSINSRNAAIYWEYAKIYQSSITRILSRLMTPIDDDLLAPVMFEWVCLRRRFRFQVLKLGRKIRKATNKTK